MNENFCDHVMLMLEYYKHEKKVMFIWRENFLEKITEEKNYWGRTNKQGNKQINKRDSNNKTL